MERTNLHLGSEIPYPEQMIVGIVSGPRVQRRDDVGSKAGLSSPNVNTIARMDGSSVIAVVTPR